MSKHAFIFPGQGSQAVGMGLELAKTYPEARALFDQVDDALGIKLSSLMFEGPADVLQLTENAQPALMAVSMAVIRVLEAKGISVGENASFVAGHSLGEYSALCAAGTFCVPDTARLLRTRGQAMQRAVPVGEGSMAAIIGLDLQSVSQVAKNAAHGQVCEVANDNAPGQVVVSGAAPAVERALEMARAAGAKRAIILPVSAPFHCSLMEPAAATMEQALALVEMKEPVVPLVSNVLAAPITDTGEIRRRLVEQVTGMVRWRQSVAWLTGAGGVDDLLEIGSGKVLGGLVRRINRDVSARAVGLPADIDALVASFDASS